MKRLLSRNYSFVNQDVIQTFPCAVRETSQVAVVSLHVLSSQSVCCLSHTSMAKDAW